ncbi:MAG: hypothetical protein ACE14P_08650 [Methanotrichaceae archaeon]
MNIERRFGGVIRSLLALLRDKRSFAMTKVKPNFVHIELIVILALLFTGINGNCLAQVSQDNWESGNSKAVNASSEISSERSTIFWIEARPNGMPVENSDLLFSINGDSEDTKYKVRSLGKELITYRISAVSNVSSPEPHKGDIVTCLFSGRGFALKGNETHVLRMNVELIKDVDPIYLRDLMTSNKSIEDIKEGLNAKAKEGAASLRGNLRINESSYSLLNTRFVPSKDNDTVVDADVAKLYLKPAPGMIMRPDIGNKIAIAGHIKVTVASSKDGLIGKGDLVMSSDEYSGKYMVLLHMEKPMPCDSLPPGGDIAPPPN